MGRGDYFRIDAKNTTDDFLSVKVADLYRHGKLSNGFHTVTWTRNGQRASFARLFVENAQITFQYVITDANRTPLKVNKPIHLTSTPCNYGGQRKWFICDCGKRVGRLFIHKQHIACRHCFDLVYPSQREDELCRAGRRLGKLEAKLKGQTFRPKGMHHKTYERLTEKIINAEVEREGLFMRIANERFKL